MCSNMLICDEFICANGHDVAIVSVPLLDNEVTCLNVSMSTPTY